MKKRLARIIAAVLAAILPLCMAVAEDADEAALYPFIDLWVDEGVCVEIWEDESGLHCQAVLGDGEGEATVWEYEKVRYDAAEDCVFCENGSRRQEEYDEETGELRIQPEAEDLWAVFSLDDEERLFWNDSEGLCGRFVFRRLDDVEETEYWNMANAFEGAWISGSVSLDIFRQDDGFGCVIFWKRSGTEATQWTYTCVYDELSGTLCSVGPADRTECALDKNGAVTSSEEVYDDGEAVFSLNDASMVLWEDWKEDAGAGLTFARAPLYDAPSPVAFAERYFREIAPLPIGTAGASLSLAGAAARVCAFAADFRLWNPGVDGAWENMLEAWETLDAEDRESFLENFERVSSLIDACLEDWDAYRGLFDDAGAAQQMEATVYDPLNRQAWQNLREYTRIICAAE